MAASLFGVGNVINLDAQGTLMEESFIATAGQTLFTLTTFVYAVGTGSIKVFVNGQKQRLGVDYTETSNNSFTWSSTDLASGDVVSVIGFPEIDLSNNLDPNIRAQLASTDSASDGAGMVGYSPNVNYVAGTFGESVVDSEVNILWFVTSEAARQDIKTGAGLIDVGSYMDAACSFADTFKKNLLWPAGMWRRTTPWVIPPSVGVRGETAGWPTPTYDPANSWRYGPVLFKAHTGNGITKTGTTAYGTAAALINCTVSSHRTTYAGGNGIVLDQTGTCDLVRCQVFGVGGDGIVVGVTSGDVTGHTSLQRCYVNNCTGAAYRIRAKWCEFNNSLSDGCTHGAYLDNAPETRFVNCHFEGFTTAGVKFANACGGSKFVGKNFIANTGNATYGVDIDNVAGNSFIGVDGVKFQGPSSATAITFTGALIAATSGTLTVSWAGVTGSYGIYFSDGSIKTATLTNGSAAVSWTGAVTATASAQAMNSPASIAVNIQGPAGLGVSISGCEFNGWATGVKDGGASRTRISRSEFYACGLPIYANSSSTRYTELIFDSTVGAFDIDHIGGGGNGIWSVNQFTKGIKPTSSGVSGNFGSNLVINNKGWKTRATGYTSGTVASGTSIAHGLSGSAIPGKFVGIPTSPATYTNFRLGSADGTNIQFLWDGGASLQIQWEATATCELQT